mmetsp:Transcript_15748/g.47249  ORF Transcript_15748/g.47249 Transcript_15748/m.47249 type:complete len:334 (+) Transcript_15748:196-1197(+)
MITVLNTIEGYVEETPPLTQAMRYGNQAFRTVFALVEANAVELMREVLAEPTLANSGAAQELATYLLHSMGNATRIDYGTGHETCFMALLYCLHVLGVFCERDFASTILRVFNRYVLLMRRIQSTYYLEPAGSHGVWSLDDYMFLPFYFGAAQLVPHERLRPQHALLEETRETYNDDYMFMSAIEFIHKMKTGPFFEHSPILYDIMKGVKLWYKVNSGMLKMYKVEVLGKFPIMQHFLFGSLLHFVPDPTVQHSGQGMLTPMGIGPVLDSGVATRRPPPAGADHIGSAYPMGGGMSTGYPGADARLMGVMPPRGSMPPTGVMPPRGSMPPREH